MEDRANKPTAGDHPMTSRSSVSRWGTHIFRVARVYFVWTPTLIPPTMLVLTSFLFRGLEGCGARGILSHKLRVFNVHFIIVTAQTV
jgi:hypothetical protein